MHRRTPSAEISAAAHHEAGHALAIVAAFRDAVWLPRPPPLLPVTYVEIVESPGETGGCVGANIYSVRWPIDCIAPPFRPLMEAQVIIELAGGGAEAFHRGAPPHEVLSFATAHCAIDVDLDRAAAVLGDLRRLTGCRLDAQPFAERTLALLLDNWRAVEALADELIAYRRIEGPHVAAIIEHMT
jgi:hypothetical protein